jgi:perosamine synthetase
MNSIPLFKPYMADTVQEAVQGVMSSGKLAAGPDVAAFEQELGRYLGIERILGLSSASIGISLALMDAGIGQGDEVIMSPLTCLATAMPVLASGASIRWCDIDLVTGMPDVSEIEAVASERTKAVLLYHWNGHVAPIDNVTKWAACHGVVVVEDATEAFGASVGGVCLGNRTADYTVLSFHAAKPLNTGDGGAIAVTDPDRFASIRRMTKFGIDDSNFRLHDGDLNPNSPVEGIGFCGYLQNISAAIGRENLKGIDRVLEAGRINYWEIFHRVSSFQKIKVVEHRPDDMPQPWTFNFLTPRRAALKRKLIDMGIKCQRLHLRCDDYSAFPNAGSALPNVDRFDLENLSVPCGWWLGTEDVDRIVDALSECA